MTRTLAPGAELVVATHNRGKLVELRALFAPFVHRIVGAPELGLAEPDETGETFADNAILKARAAASAADRPAIADDSGLVVPALGGDPGVRSARWAGPDRDWARAMREIERRLGADRRASMVCVLALAWPDGHAKAFEGRVDGSLVTPPRGELGFGYEPMFAPHGSLRTYGEMPRETKHLDDPRARAFAELRAACLVAQ